MKTKGVQKIITDKLTISQIIMDYFSSAQIIGGGGSKLGLNSFTICLSKCL